MARIVVGPFNRVEGDLEVQLDIADGAVRSARVNSPMYRGFEQILHGKDPLDGLVIAPRVCGICSVSQSMAAAYALADLAGVQMPPNGELATNLALATENLADHFTHFYLFFMPDFARTVYAERAWYPMVSRRFKAMNGTASAEAMAARAEFMHVMGILAGRWPHSLSLQPGGTARAIEPGEHIRLLAILGEFRAYLERRLFGDALEHVAALDSVEALQAWLDAAPAESSDLRLFLHIAQDLSLACLGRAYDRFMSYGNYPIGGQRLFSRGVWERGERALDTKSISEDLASSWMTGAAEPRHPEVGVTLPDLDKDGAYSWCKAPRLDGQPAEVGALARQVVDGHPLIRALVTESGGNVRNRVLARMIEIARLVPVMEQWVRALRPGEAFCHQAKLPDEGGGQGLVEAARGSLGHWIGVRNGRVLNYQIIAPTTWNFSPRDGQGVAGPLERALQGAPVRDGERDPVAVQHIVRSFDPCMVCTVH